MRIHSIRGKPLTDNINTLWISAIFFWLSLKNPFIREEDFLSINTEAKSRISLTKLKTDLSCIKKKLAKQYTDKAIEAVTKLGLLVSYEIKTGQGGELKIVFSLNKDW